MSHCDHDIVSIQCGRVDGFDCTACTEESFLNLVSLAQEAISYVEVARKETEFRKRIKDIVNQAYKQEKQ